MCLNEVSELYNNPADRDMKVRRGWKVFVLQHCYGMLTPMTECYGIETGVRLTATTDDKPWASLQAGGFWGSGYKPMYRPGFHMFDSCADAYAYKNVFDRKFLMGAKYVELVVLPVLYRGIVAVGEQLESKGKVIVAKEMRISLNWRKQIRWSLPKTAA